MGIAEHKGAALSPAALRVAVITVSDTRTPSTDQGGDLAAALLEQAGFVVSERHLVPDESELLRARVQAVVRDSVSADQVVRVQSTRADAVLVTGGTGLSPRDITVDAIAPLFEPRLDGFGELFRMLSFSEIGAAAMLSRACAGLLAGVPIFLVPGSPAAIRLALERLILPELGHLISQMRRPSGDDAARARKYGFSLHHDHGHDHHR